MRCWRERKCAAGGLERCTVAASAAAHRVINRPKIKKGRIAFALSIYRPRADESGATVPGHAAGLEPLQRVAGAAEWPAVNYVCSANDCPKR